MRMTALLFAFTGVVLVPLTGQAAITFQLDSVKVDLPESDRMFTGEGADVVNNSCLACHSAGMVLNQPALAKTAWQAEVNKMIQIYKAPVAGADAAAIVDYLARTKGTGS
ncbi:MAG TPA: cytochrome c [Acetobacteraceae bacterium]|jgi:cytochrome c5